MENQKSNACGIVSLCVGWLVPIAGVTLAIISLSRKEPNKTLGIIGLVVSIFSWIVWMGINASR